MAGVNKVIIVGNLGRDPEIKYSKNGNAVASFPVATSETWTDKNSGQRQEQTEWHRIVIFGKMAETCEKYLAKGRQVYVEGKLKTTSYDKEGQTHYKTDIVASTVQFLGSKQDSGGAPGNDMFSSSPGQSRNTYQQGGNQGGSYRGGGSNISMVKDDDIPF